MTTRQDILTFLRDPATFARSAVDQSLWTSGLDDFATPSILRHQDRPLRPAQESAWRGLADNRVGLVLGPPGTGKTHLLSWLIAGHGAVLSAAGQPARTFITAFTKNAVGNVLDSVAKRQALHDPNAPEPIFYGSPPSSTLSGRVRLLGNDDEAEVVQAIASRRTVVGATIWSLYRLIASGTVPQTDGQAAELFDLICIDEASQMVLGHGLMALAGMAPSCRVVVSGDDQQLPPVRASRSTRIEGRELGGSLYSFLKSTGTAEFALEETFRLNAPLAHFPERKFYLGRYVSAAPNQRLSLSAGWSNGLNLLSRIALDPALPIVVIVHNGPPAATLNPFEASLAATLASDLAERVVASDGSAIEPRTFWSDVAAIVSPHRSHVSAIRSRLPAALRADAFVETVDRIQGKERDAIILSYCVADPEFALAEADFIFSAERLNVATTRARTKLIVIVSARLLESVPSEQETVDKVELLREFVFSCNHLTDTVLDDPAGRKITVQVRARGFEGDTYDVDLKPDETPEPSRLAMTPELEGVLTAIRGIAASSKHGNATLSEVRKKMAGIADLFAKARSLHLLGWISLEQQNGPHGPFWTARPRQTARTVYDVDLDTVRSRIAQVVRDTRGNRHCLYNFARDRFAWMSESEKDVLLPVIQQLQREGLLTLGTVGEWLTIAMTAAERAEPAEPLEPAPELDIPDYTLLNRLEDIEAARINFGVFDSWTSAIDLARDMSVSADDAFAMLSRLEQNGHVMLAEDGRVRSRMAELARELRHVKQRFKTDDAPNRPYLVRNVKVELRERSKPWRNRRIDQVFDQAAENATPSQAEALRGLHRALASMWGESAGLAEFQVKGLMLILAALRGEGLPSIAVAAETGSGKTEAAALPLIAAALADRLQGVSGVRAILTYPRVRLAANQAQRLASYLAAMASIPNIPLLTLGLQVSDVPDSFDNMHAGYHEAWRPAGAGTFEFPFFACPSCGQTLHLRADAGADGADSLVCITGDWRYDGWIGSKAQLRERPPALFLPTMDSLHQWLHDPRYGSLFGDDPRFAAPRAVLADEIHLYTHIHGAQVGMTLRRLAARSETNTLGAPPMVAIGMSATISDAGEAWGRLIGRRDVEVIRAESSELQPNPRGREYFFFIQPEIESRGADIAGASTTIQSLICLGHGMRRRTGKEGGYRSLVFFDSIDKMRRLHGAYVDAEEGKELAALRITAYGDDASGRPQTRCCRQPIGCDRFADGECWHFAANDARQCGAHGLRAPGTPLRVARTPIYSGTSSDAEALVKGADVVFATSSLEVGYDDPDISLVYQHYAPQNIASFVQRKGRGGRALDDRPTTAVTLSIYSPRDSWWFRRPREMISPTGFQIPLNPDNFFVRRGQALAALLDGLARHRMRESVSEQGNKQPTEAEIRQVDQLAKTILGENVWCEFGVADAWAFWTAAIAAQPPFSYRYLSDLRKSLCWAPNLLFDTINLPALSVSGPEVSGGLSEDIGLALANIAPGNATRRYHPTAVHWRPPVQGLAPWLDADDYARAERRPLAADAASVLADLPLEVRGALVDLHPDLCRPVTATLERLGRLAGAYWTPEVGYTPDRNPPTGPCNNQNAVRHDSVASLRGFLLVTVDQAKARPVPPIQPFPGVAEVSAHTGGMHGSGSGLHVARVFWGSDAEVRFDTRGADSVSISQTFSDPASGRPLLHGYQVETEGLRFRIDDKALSSCVAAVEEDFKKDDAQRRWHEAQFLRYLIESRGNALGIAPYEMRLGASILATAIADPTLESRFRRLVHFWSPSALEVLFDDVRVQLLSQHPLMTPMRVARAAAALSTAVFRNLLSDCVSALRHPDQLSGYLRSTIIHSLMLRLKLLVTQVGQGDERQILAHAQLPLQFGKDASLDITICEAGADGDGTMRGVIDGWHRALELVSSGYLGACPNAEEDAQIRRFWAMRDRHEHWRGFDARNPQVLRGIARELGSSDREGSLGPTLTRILFALEAIEAEPFAVYDIASDIEAVRARATDRLGRPLHSWELASAAVTDALSGVAPVLKRLHDAYDALDPNGEGSLSPDVRLAEQVFRLGAELCVDGCRSCVHQASDLMNDSLTEASVSRSLLQRFLASGD
jgi:ATP-dependent helicase YprA (DUF1998 family)